MTRYAIIDQSQSVLSLVDLEGSEQVATAEAACEREGWQLLVAGAAQPGDHWNGTGFVSGKSIQQIRTEAEAALWEKWFARMRQGVLVTVNNTTYQVPTSKEDVNGYRVSAMVAQANPTGTTKIYTADGFGHVLPNNQFLQAVASAEAQLDPWDVQWNECLADIKVAESQAECDAAVAALFA